LLEGGTLMVWYGNSTYLAPQSALGDLLARVGNPPLIVDGFGPAPQGAESEGHRRSGDVRSSG